MPSTKVYVRLSSSAVSVTGTIDFTSTGATAETVAISGSNYPSISFSNTVTNPLCFGDSGSAVSVITGGSGDFSYQWNNEGIAMVNDTNLSVAGLAA